MAKRLNTLPRTGICLLLTCLYCWAGSLQVAQAQAGTFRWTGQGNGRSWTDTANWQQEIDGSWQAATRYPGMDEDDVTLAIEADDERIITHLPYRTINGRSIFFVSKLRVLSGTFLLTSDDTTPADAQFLLGPPLKSQVIQGYTPNVYGPDVPIFPADNPTLEILPAAQLILSAELSAYQWQVPRFAQFILAGLLLIR